MIFMRVREIFMRVLIYQRFSTCWGFENNLTYLIAAEMIPQNWIHFHGYALLLLAWAGEI